MRFDLILIEQLLFFLFGCICLFYESGGSLKLALTNLLQMDLGKHNDFVRMNQIDMQLILELTSMTDIPDGPGGSNPSDEGKIKQCERCNKQFVVKKREEADECIYHWGRSSMKRENGPFKYILSR